MADIFISYKREDQEEHGRVAPLAEALRAEGYDVFYDVQIPPGSTWESVLEQKIADARCVLVLWSDHSVGSDWVKEEADIAKAAGKLIPVFIDRVRAPLGFSRIEGADLAHWDGSLDHPEWKNLVAAVKARIGAGIRTPDLNVKSVRINKRVEVNAGKRSGGGRGALWAMVAVAILSLAGAGFWWTQMRTEDRSPPAQAVAVEAPQLAFDRYGAFPANVEPGGRVTFQAALRNESSTPFDTPPRVDVLFADGENLATAKVEAIGALTDFPALKGGQASPSISGEFTLPAGAEDGRYWICGLATSPDTPLNASACAPISVSTPRPRPAADDEAWAQAQRAGTIQAYGEFALRYSSSSKRASADEAAARIARGEGALEAYETYLRYFPTGVFSATAKSRLATLREQSAARAGADLSSRTFRLNGVDISNIRLSPAPPSRIATNEKVIVNFNYDACCNMTARIWFQPVIEGGGCSGRWTGSQEMKQSGTSQRDFFAEGDGCRSARVTGLSLTVKDELKDDSKSMVIPIDYAFR